MTNYRVVDLGGAGGKEKEIAKLFPHLIRVHQRLYDFVDPKTGDRIEVKKTGDKRLQAWVDEMKFVGLSAQDRAIIFRFVQFDPKTGKCVDVIDTTVGEVADRLIPNKADHSHLLALKESNPKRQMKTSIRWRVNPMKVCEWCHVPSKKMVRTKDGRFCSDGCAEQAKIEQELNEGLAKRSTT